MSSGPDMEIKQHYLYESLLLQARATATTKQKTPRPSLDEQNIATTIDSARRVSFWPFKISSCVEVFSISN